MDLLERPPSIRRHLQESMQPPRLLENFFDQTEISALIEIEESLLASHRYIKSLGQVTCTELGWTPQHESLLHAKLEKEIGPFRCNGGNYFLSPVSFYPHCDTGKDAQQMPYKNVLIPLRVEPASAQPQFILFQQRYFGLAATFYLSGRGPNQYYNASVTSGEQLLHYKSGEAFDRETHQKYLDFMPYEDLAGLSVEAIFPWRPGDCIIFDSTQLHASGSLRAAGARKKLGLSILTVATNTP